VKKKLEKKVIKESLGVVSGGGSDTRNVRARNYGSDLGSAFEKFL
jgi:hypothetical protein